MKTIISQRDYKKSIQYLFQQVLTPIVSLELDDLPATRFFKEQRFPWFIFPHHRSKHQNQRDDVDFFFNENNNRGGTAKGGLIRQDSKDSIDNYFKVRKKSKKKPHRCFNQGSTQPASRFTNQDLFHPSRPRPGVRPSLHISGLGPARREEEEVEGMC